MDRAGYGSSEEEVGSVLDTGRVRVTLCSVVCTAELHGRRVFPAYAQACAIPACRLHSARG